LGVKGGLEKPIRHQTMKVIWGELEKECVLELASGKKEIHRDLGA